MPRAGNTMSAFIESPKQIGSLSQFGVTYEEWKRLQYLTPQEREVELGQQIASYTKEVLDDSPVSTPYSYWFGTDGRLYTNPSLKEIYNVERQFDHQERAGTPLEGFRKVTTRLAHYPNQLTVWYSPAGPASFDSNPNSPYSQIDYHDGQLYFQYYDPFQKKVNAVAVKVTNEHIVRQFMPDTFTIADRKTDEKDRIRTIMTNPHTFFCTVDDFFAHQWENGEVYWDKRNQPHYLYDVLAQLREVLSGTRKAHAHLDPTVRAALQSNQLSEGVIRQAYISTIRSYMKEKGYREMSLSGCSGGSRVELSTLEQILSMPKLEVKDLVTLYSSTLRKLTQSKTFDYKNDPNLCRCSQSSEPHFHCLGNEGKTCNYAIPVGHGITECSECHATATCK